MATFQIGGGNQGNISPFLTGKATPMSLPPGFLAEAGRQAAGLQKGIAGAGADIGDAIIARAKEEEVKKEGLAILMADNESMKKYFPAKETATRQVVDMGITSPQELTTQLVKSDIHPRLEAFGQAVDMHQIAAPPKTIQPNPLEEILGGEAWEKVTSGNISKGELRGYLRGVNNYKEEKYREVVDAMNQMKLDHLKELKAEKEAMKQAASLLSKDVPGYTEKSMQDVFASKASIEGLVRDARQDKAMSQEEFNLLEEFGRRESFTTRGPVPIDLKTLQEQKERDAIINLISQSQGLKQLNTLPEGIQQWVRESFDHIPPEMVEEAKRGNLSALKSVADTITGAQDTEPISTQQEMDDYVARLRKDAADTNTPFMPPGLQPGYVFDITKGKYVPDPNYLPKPTLPIDRTVDEERIYQLQRGFKPKADGSGFEQIVDVGGVQMGGREITPADVRQMNPEDRAIYAGLDKSLYTGGDQVIGEEEVSWDVPSRPKSNAEMRKEMETFLREGNQWSPAMKKRLDDYMPEFAPGELEQATLNGMALPGFLYDPIGKKYIEISTNEPIEFNEIQTKLAAYRNLMKSAQRDVDEILGEDSAYDPASAFAYWQKVGPDYLTSAKGKEYEAAAGRWIEGRLRFATGAQAPAAEYLKDWRNFFPVPGDSERAVDRKKRSRDEVYRTLSKVLGAGRTSYLDEGAPVLPPAGAAGGGGQYSRDSQGNLQLNK
jgi:hypothetical protein